MFCIPDGMHPRSSPRISIPIGKNYVNTSVYWNLEQEADCLVWWPHSIKPTLFVLLPDVVVVVQSISIQAKILLTDYPDPLLIRTLETNVEENLGNDAMQRTSVQVRSAAFIRVRGGADLCLGFHLGHPDDQFASQRTLRCDPPQRLTLQSFGGRVRRLGNSRTSAHIAL